MKIILPLCNHIHEKPVKAGLVKIGHNWVNFLATNYQDMESVIEVEKIVQCLITFN